MTREAIVENLKTCTCEGCDFMLGVNITICSCPDCEFKDAVIQAINIVEAQDKIIKDIKSMYTSAASGDTPLVRQKEVLQIIEKHLEEATKD